MYFKKFLVSGLLFTTLTTIAQKSKILTDNENFFRFGAKAGLNANKITGRSYKQGFNYNYQLGVISSINFSSRLECSLK